MSQSVWHNTFPEEQVSWVSQSLEAWASLFLFLPGGFSRLPVLSEPDLIQKRVQAGLERWRPWEGLGVLEE